MTREEVFNGVQNIFRDIFDEDDMVIENGTSSNEIEDWDSLNHINLTSAIEIEYNIKFTLRELMTLKNVEDIINFIIEKL